MIVMRDPIERFLAGGRCGPYHEGKEKGLDGDPTNDPENQALFWEYANAECADNYALRVLVNDDHCINGADTSLACLESAKNLLKRFTFIIDQACLNDSLVAVGKELHLNITDSEFRHSLNKLRNRPTSLKERIKNDTLYEFLQHRFRRDIELYQWSKTKSIVQCEVDDSLSQSNADKSHGNNAGQAGALIDSDTTEKGATSLLDNTEVQVEESTAESTREVQIANYRKGTALILSVHITHHAGTFLCAAMRAVGPVPNFACMGVKDDQVWPEEVDLKLCK